MNLPTLPSSSTSSHLCPCGSHKVYSKCCEPFIQGEQIPPTPEALMRSRYSAFTQANTQYIIDTMKGAVAQQFDPEKTRTWTQHVTWLDLQILQAPLVTDNDTIASVEFIARYRFQEKIEHIHEISEFHRENGRWYYIDGRAGNATTRSKSTKIGRNDPCPCHSGKKFKKCCGSNPEIQ